MSEPFVGEIRMMPFTYAPYQWAYCDGQSMPISQNTILYAVIGTTYGGDGVSTFNLPDLKDRAPINYGAFPGSDYYQIGLKYGSPTNTLLTSQIPAHTHTLNVSKVTFAEETTPGSTVLPQTLLTGSGNPRQNVYKEEPPPPAQIQTTDMAATACSISGSSLDHENRQPFLCVNFCIALDGEYPARP